MKELIPTTFEPINDWLAKDQNSIYLTSEPFEGPDAESFEAYEDRSDFFHDKEAVYYFPTRSGAKLDGVMVGSFQIIATEYDAGHLYTIIKDEILVYVVDAEERDPYYLLRLIPLEHVDAGTFEYLGDWNYQDKNGKSIIELAVE